MNIDDINNDYFEWLYNLVCDGLYTGRNSYRKLLMFLHNTEFTWTIPMDENRASDGIDLRYRFSVSQGYEGGYLSEYIDGPCSVFEMILALAIRCEENIMDDTAYGDRTTQWFWGMINNLGLGEMVDGLFDKDYVNTVIKDFLNRDYKPNGKGGLFTIRNCDHDLRDVEIWYQLNWYLDSILGG